MGTSKILKVKSFAMKFDSPYLDNTARKITSKHTPIGEKRHSL